MATYTRTNVVVPGGQDWDDVTQWSFSSATLPTQIILLNSDGTFTEINGVGFALDGSNEPTAGTISSVRRLSTDGTTELEQITGLSHSLVGLFNNILNAGAFLLDGNDSINGGILNDGLAGFAGNDTINGGDGNDSMEGGAGADVLNGGDGFNQYFGGTGNDTFNGGTNNVQTRDYDTARYDDGTATAGITVTMSAVSQVVGDASVGTDTLNDIERVIGTDFVDTYTADGTFAAAYGTFNEFEGLGGNDTITGNGNTRISFAQATDDVTVTFTGAGQGTAFSTNGGDLASIGTDSFTGVRHVRGSAFDDTFNGSNNASQESFRGQAGDDTINGGGGPDRADYRNSPGGINADLSGGAIGSGTVSDGYGDTDTLTGIENIRGSEFNDVIRGDAGANNFLGQNGNDVFRGLGGNDTFDGGGGIDSARYDQDVNFGGAGAVTVNLATGTATDGFGNTDTLIDIELVRGTSLADSLTGGDTTNDGFEGFRGLGGNDTIDGGSGFDEARYDQDANYGGTGGVNVNLSTNTATDGFGDTDTLTSIEGVRGTNQADVLIGDVQDNQLIGLGGNDTLTGGDGSDGVRYDQDANYGGGAGVTVNLQTNTATDGFGDTDTLSSIERVRGTAQADTFIGSNAEMFFDETFRGLGGNDTINGGGGWDEVRYDRDADYGGGSGVTVNLATGTATDGFGDTDTLSNLEAVRGSNQADVLTGDSNNNSLTGLGGNDTLTGGTGFDRVRYDQDANNGGTAGVTVNLETGTAIDGFGDTDTLSGFEGVRGTNQADSITGSNSVGFFTEAFRGLGGNDTIDGGDGFDEARYDRDAGYGGNGAVTVNLATGTATDGFGDTDTLINIEYARGTSLADSLTGNGGAFNAFRGLGGNDTIDGGAGRDEARYSEDANYGGAGAVTVNLATGTATDGFGDTDTLISIEDARGTAQADTLIGNAEDNQLRGLAGNDTLTGGAGDGDEVGYHNDAAYGGNSGVTVNLATNTATDGFGDTDTLSGIEGVRGTEFADAFTGDGNDNFFRGLAGNDTIDGGLGSDWTTYSRDIFARPEGAVLIAVNVDLGAGTAVDSFGGSDTLTSIENASGGTLGDVLTGSAENNVFRGLTGNDTIDGIGGNDTADYSRDALYGDAISQAGDGAVTVNLGTGTATDGFGDTDTLTSIENAIGTDQGDTLTGSAVANVLEGGAGNDTIDGGAGNDTLDGGAGADSLDGGGGDDILNIDGADTSFFGDTGTDTVNVLDNSGVNISVGIATRVEIVNGGGGNDTIDATGAATAVTISGLAGNDVITGAGGSDSLFGNGGDDTLTGAAGHDQMFGGAGADSYFGGDGNDRFFVDGDDLVFDGGAGWDRVIVNTTSGTSLTLQDLGIEVAQGNIGNDTIDASAMTTGIQLFGFGGLDTLTGGSGNDFLIGGDDADILNGGGGDDLVFGGAGGDTFDLGAGNDIVWLDAGDTLTDAGAGNDRAFVLDTAGANISIGAANVETVYGNTGNDVIDGSGATVAMLLTGGQGGNDTLTGGTLGDTLIGNDGVDTLVGGAGVDILNAGTGADFLTGGAGNDDLFGLLDGNTDTFIFADGSGRDRVFTWEDGIDLIDLSGHSGASQFSDLTITQVGANTEIDVGADTIVLASINAGTVDATDFVF